MYIDGRPPATIRRRYISLEFGDASDDASGTRPLSGNRANENVFTDRPIDRRRKKWRLPGRFMRNAEIIKFDVCDAISIYCMRCDRIWTLSAPVDRRGESNALGLHTYHIEMQSMRSKV